MSNCIYHPNIPAVMQCERCGKPICEEDKRNFFEDREKGGHRIMHTFCPLCNDKATRTQNITYISLGILFVIFIVGMVWLNVEKLAIILTGITFGIVIIFLYIRAKSDKEHTKKDLDQFYSGMTWKTPGDADASINELLELSSSEIKERGGAIYNEILRASEEPSLRFYLNKKRWTYHDIGRMSLTFRKDIAYWSWRRDLSEKNQTRVSFVFSYLMAVSLFGETEAHNIIRSAPPSFIQPGLMEKLLK